MFTALNAELSDEFDMKYLQKKSVLVKRHKTFFP